MRTAIGWILILAGLAGVAAAVATAHGPWAEITALRNSIAGRIEERRITREELIEVRQRDAGLRASRDELPDSTFRAERSTIYQQLKRNEAQMRRLKSKELEHTRLITLEEYKLAREKRTFAIRVAPLAGGGLVMCALGFVFLRRRVGT